MADALRPYLRKRDFSITREPRGGKRSKSGQLAFVVQKHAASHLHYDFRLELGGTLKSWAVPKGPSLDPTVKRMAVHVEDHPMAYAGFEGDIPKGQYGGGTVIVWDNGTWEPVGDAQAGYAAGKLKFRLHGHKLSGGWTLVRMHGRATERQDPWLLIKERDESARPASQYSVVDAEPASVLSDRTIPDPAPTATRKSTSKSGAATGATSGPSTATATTKATTKATTATATRPATRTRTSTPKTPRSSTAGTASKPVAAGARAPARPSRPAHPAVPDGAKKAALPATLSPQLATLVAQAPDDDGWTYEIKFDGYRLLARVDGSDVRLVTRNGNDWSSRMKGLVDAVRDLGIGSA
ncbi:MAG TPA: DNA polymerase ligase N-terminal domain-containing protein, partial [Caldimonas sp.]|nr:DNA polymerase ligase N-terminal domain-containing protein [Caldimonas sp.]